MQANTADIHTRYKLIHLQFLASLNLEHFTAVDTVRVLIRGKAQVIIVSSQGGWTMFRINKLPDNSKYKICLFPTLISNIFPWYEHTAGPRLYPLLLHVGYWCAWLGQCGLACSCAGAVDADVHDIEACLHVALGAGEEGEQEQG